MKGSPGKAPAIQWYYRDWLSDRQLQRSRVASRGIWMNLLMYMIDCSNDKTNYQAGRLEYLNIREICSLAGCTEQEAWDFIEDALDYGFCDVELDKNETFHIMSRRLSVDAEKRAKWREQKRKQRDEKELKGDVHNDVRDLSTPSLPLSSTSTATAVNNILSSNSQKTASKIPYQEIVAHLNEKANTHFRYSTKKTRNLIRTRFNEGFQLENFFTVIDNKASQWKSDPEMVKYLRPETLFGNKFEGYLNEQQPNQFNPNKKAVA